MKKVATKLSPAAVMVVILALMGVTLTAGTAQADAVSSAKAGFDKELAKCTNGQCPTDSQRKKLERRRRSVKRACDTRDGAANAAGCYAQNLDKWVSKAFGVAVAQVDPVTQPEPVKKPKKKKKKVIIAGKNGKTFDPYQGKRVTEDNWLGCAEHSVLCLKDKACCCEITGQRVMADNSKYPADCPVDAKFAAMESSFDDLAATYTALTAKLASCATKGMGFNGTNCAGCLNGKLFRGGKCVDPPKAEMPYVPPIWNEATRPLAFACAIAFLLLSVLLMVALFRRQKPGLQEKIARWKVLKHWYSNLSTAQRNLRANKDPVQEFNALGKELKAASADLNSFGEPDNDATEAMEKAEAAHRDASEAKRVAEEARKLAESATDDAKQAKLSVAKDPAAAEAPAGPVGKPPEIAEKPGGEQSEEDDLSDLFT